MSASTPAHSDYRRQTPVPQAVFEACNALAGGMSTVAEAAALAGCTERELRHAFRLYLGVSPRQFQQSARLNKAKEALRTVPNNTLEALFTAGYGSVRGLYEAGASRLGMTPARFAHKGKGLTLQVETANHHLGLLMVAGTARGVSFVGLGNAIDELRGELCQDYPLAQLEAARAPRWIDGVLRALDIPSAHRDLPLDIFATAFQAKVWEAIREIPPGETRSYSGVAAALGNPNATRAVARACASNSVAILIPCHRVVGVQGALTGYRWGIERKKALLLQERHSEP